MRLINHKYTYDGFIYEILGCYRHSYNIYVLGRCSLAPPLIIFD